MDCTSNCRFAGHADVVLSAVTREELNDIKGFVKYFCENGSRARDSFGRNALHVAASCGKKDVVQWLLDVGQLGVDDKDFESEWTALHRSCYYGHLSCALLLLQYGANIYEKDIEGLSPVELLMFDSPRKSFSCDQPNPGREKWPNKKGASVDVSSWGRNTNFTLGHGDEKERYIPEVIDVFAKRIKISIQEIVIRKFHTVFLAANGSVWTCGHGQGGRLGHGHEKTILVPKKIDALLDRMCIAVAAGQDHSVVLCESGSVFTFGLNKFHQMGHHPSSSQYLTPKQIQVKSLKGKKFVGIAAGKFHTVLYTRKEVYSCGLNAGQLGHSKGGRTQVTPRQVSALHLKDRSISLVTCSNAATVCATENGDVYLIYQYTHRKIIPKLSNISKLLVVGGRLDDSLFKETTEKKCGPLTIYGLYGDGKVFQWRESDKSVRECHWSLRKAVSVTDIACGKNLHIVTDQGEVYFEEGVSASVKKPTKILPRNPDFISYSHCVKQEEVVEVSLTRVRCLHRVIKLACDQHSQNFAVIQTDPSLGCTITPRVTPPEMDEHLTRLYEDAQLEDSFHDVDIKVKGRTLAAHKLILAEGSEKFRRLLDKAEASLGDGDEFREIPIICCGDETFEVIQEIIEFLYTGTCASLGALEESCCVETEKKLLCDSVIEEDIFNNELAWSLEEVDFDSLDNLQFPLSPGFSQLVHREEKNSVATPKDEKFSTSKGNVNRGNKDGISVDFTRRNELLRVAKKYRINELVSRLQDVRNGGEKFRKRFRRDEHTDYHDVVIEAEDGVEFACHKCILVARLEYFSIMLTTGWMESSGDFVRLKMPIPSPILKVIIDFLYTDEALSVKESRELEFLGKLLTVADQLWIIRLKEICELTLASLISLKNAAEMLEFSILYNAEQLKNVCLEFICLNISCLFEAGSLDFLSEDVQNELSTVYREMIPRMAWRVLTPSDIHLSVPWPQPECPSKRKTSRSQRRSRTSESDVADGHAVQENGSEQNKLSETKTEEEEESLAHELSEEKRTDETTSLDCESTKVQEKEMKVGLWYRKDRDMNPELVSSTLVTSTGMTRTISNPLPISRRKNETKVERQPWGSQSLSPQSSDLRAIMEQEKTQSVEEDYQLSERKKEGKSPLGGKSRLSQKERKKLRKSSEEQLSCFKNVNLETVPSDVTKTSPTRTVKANPWKSCSPVSRPSVSFRELIEEEEHQELSVLVKEKKKKDIPKRRIENLTRSNSLSGSKGTPPSAWQNGSLACSPPNNPMKFNKIQELQEQETANRERSMKKPLSLIQLEDKAIEQLLEHYGGRFNACELIVVQRETRPERSPNWVN